MDALPPRRTGGQRAEVAEAPEAEPPAGLEPARIQESLALFEQMGDQQGLAYNLVGLALVAASQGLAQRSVQLASAAQALLDAIEGSLETNEQQTLEQAMQAARQALGEAQFAAAWAAGQALSRAEALALAPKNFT